MNNVIAFSRRRPVEQELDALGSVRATFESLVMTIDAAVIQMDQMIRLAGPELGSELIVRRDALAQEARIIRFELRELENEAQLAES